MTPGAVVLWVELQRVSRMIVRAAVSVLAFSALAIVSLPASSFGAETRIGMLTCLADAPAGENNAAWPISCTYEPVQGTTVQRFDGSVLGMAPSTRREGKAMMLWAVISQSPDIKAGDLADTYQADSSTPPAMVGQSSKVMLQPVQPTAQSPNVAQTLRVIQLTLPKA